MTLDPVFGMSLALLLGWVMAEAGLHKLRAPLRYAGVIDAYRLLPADAGRWLARPLGVLELGVGGALLVPALQRGAATLTAVLLAVYCVAIAVNLRRGRRDIDCGCGGAGQPISPGLLVRNAVLVGLCAPLLAAGPATRVTGWPDVLVAFAAAVVAILCYASANLLLANHRRMADAR